MYTIYKENRGLLLFLQNKRYIYSLTMTSMERKTVQAFIGRHTINILQKATK